MDCPLGLETSQKGKGQVHPSPSLQISSQWDCDKRQRKLEVERQGKKASSGVRRKRVEGAIQGRGRLELTNLLGERE